MMKFKVAAAVLAGLLIAVGVATNFTPRRVTERRTETWMEQKLPRQFDDYVFQGSTNPEQSYKMDPLTYSVLSPYGIVCRVFSNGNEQYDTVVIHSDNSDSFHDPRVCFQSQGSDLLDQRTRTIETKSRGKIPVMFIKTSYNGSPRLAAYTYNGPGGFTAESLKLIFDMFRGELTSGTVQAGTFYRFIALNPNTTEEDLTKYIGQFLDASYETSEKVL